MRLVLFLSIALIVVACKPQPAKFDASSETAFKSSAQIVADNLPEDQRPLLQAALAQLTMQSLIGPGRGSLFELAVAGQVPGNPLDRLGKLVDGRTAQEVIDLAEALEKERSQRQLTALNDQIQTLEHEISMLDSEIKQERALLDRISIKHPRYYWSKSGFSDTAIISFKLTNQSEKPLAKIVVQGLVETPGRSVPWVNEKFSFAITGGLEPGEDKKLTLAPNMFGPWANSDLKNRKDLVLTLKLIGLVDGDGKEFGLSSHQNRKSIVQRLSELRARRASLGWSGQRESNPRL